MNELIIGVAVEDSHVSVALVDFKSRKIVPNSLKRTKVNASATANEIISVWAKVVQDVSLTHSSTIGKIGIGLPGLSDFEAGIFLMNEKGRYHNLYNHNIKELLAAKLEVDISHIKIMNDSACFMQGEVFNGSARGFKSSLGITLGVGFGTASYKNGVAQNCQLAYTPFLDGIAEDYISIKWLINRFESLTGIRVNELKELKQLAQEDSRVAEVFSEFAENLSQFLTGFVRENLPEVVVIGGYMETCNRFFFDSLIQKMLSKGIKVPILRATLGEQAFIIGAASIWYESSLIHV